MDKGNSEQPVCNMARANIGTGIQKIPKSDETVKGHLKQQKQNVQPTQTQHKPETDPIQIEEQTNNLFAAIVDYCNKIFTDATGPFPVTSSRGNKYLF